MFSSSYFIDLQEGLSWFIPQKHQSLIYKPDKSGSSRIFIGTIAISGTGISEELEVIISKII